MGSHCNLIIRGLVRQKLRTVTGKSSLILTVIVFVHFLQKRFTKMANTKLKKKKRGVIGSNGLNNDAGRIFVLVIYCFGFDVNFTFSNNKCSFNYWIFQVWVTSRQCGSQRAVPWKLYTNRELKILRRRRQRKRHSKIQLLVCVTLSRLFQFV